MRLIIVLAAVLLISDVSVLFGNSDYYVLSKSTKGKEFIVAIPPNELPGIEEDFAVEAYISSNKNSSVNIRIPYLNIDRDFDIYADTPLVINNDLINQFDHRLELRDNSRSKAVFISSEDSISVSVFNSKYVTSEGYTAFPVESWGTEYRHMAYYDNYREYGALWWQEKVRRNAGFIIIASEDDTKCEITLQGVGTPEVNGKKIGEKIEFTLNRGETRLVNTRSYRNGRDDISGTMIKSDKPVGVISYHLRTNLPSTQDDFYNGLDHLSEWLMPVESWGSNFFTTDLIDSDKGDFFRVMSSEDNTELSVISYHPVTGNVIYEEEFKLNDAGEFWEYNNDFTGQNPKGIRGLTKWSADKPVLLMQYSYSASWYDNSNKNDPFMVQVVPTEQFVSSATIQVPENDYSFVRNRIAFIIENKEPGALESFIINGLPLRNYEANIQNQKIPGTDYHWCKLELSPGIYNISSNTQFGAYLYGSDQYNSYGWPVAMKLDWEAFVDTLKPELHLMQFCDDIEFSISDTTHGDTTAEDSQRDSGIELVSVLEMDNFEIVYDTLSNAGDTLSRIYSARPEVIDKRTNAYLKIEAKDYLGNTGTYEIFYPPKDKLPVIMNMEIDSPRDKYMPGEILAGNLMASLPETGFYKYDSLNLRIEYDPMEFNVLDAELDESLIPEYELSSRIENFSDKEELVLTVINPGSYIQDSIFINLKFKVLLSGSVDYKAKFSLSGIGIEPECLDIDYPEISVKVNNCTGDLRLVSSGENKFGIEEINPNPVNSNILNIDYSVGFDTYTSITIYNSMGQVIETLRASDTKAGEYSILYNINRLGSGQYFIRMDSGPYSKTRKFIISR